MNTQLNTPIVATAKSINAMLQPTGKTVVRAEKGELVLFAGYNPMLQAPASFDEESDMMGSFAVSH